MEAKMTCFLCQKHAGQVAQPPGGYIYEDDYWMVCHAPVEKGPLGTLFIESKRHVLDFAEFDHEETASYGILARKLYVALKALTGAERIYQVSMMEGIPHFHAWLLPRTPEIPERGVAFLAKDLVSTKADALKLVSALQAALK
jgi:diadenosine tetraphosphate (Ap4A) HIT family hydrolase